MSKYSAKRAAEMAVASPHGITYRFTDGDGVQCQGRTVFNGRDQAHAERRFFRQYRHVSPVTGDDITLDTERN